MERYRDVVLDRRGNAKQSATIYVYATGTTDEVQLYSDNAGTLLAQPLATDVDGEFWFYIPDGLYDINVSGSGLATKTVSRVNIQDLSAYEFDVTSYGADPTGVADSTVAIQTTIDTAEAAGGGIVKVPTGNYLISDAVTIDTDDTSIVGEGMGASVLYTTTAEHDGIVVDSCSNVRVAHLQVKDITWAGGSEAFGIRVNAGINVDIDHCKAHNCDDAGIRIGWTRTGAGPYVYTDSADCVVQNCVVTDTPEGCGIELIRAERTRCLGNFVSGSSAPGGNGLGIRNAGAQGSVISGNTVIDCNHAGISLQAYGDGHVVRDAKDIVVDGNHIEATVVGGMTSGINLFNQANHIVISNNTIKRAVAPTLPKSGIYFSHGALDYDADSITIEGNQIVGPWRYGIDIQCDVRRVMIRENMLSGMTYAAAAGRGISVNDTGSNYTIGEIFVEDNTILMPNFGETGIVFTENAGGVAMADLYCMYNRLSMNVPANWILDNTIGAIVITDHAGADTNAYIGYAPW